MEAMRLLLALVLWGGVAARDCPNTNECTCFPEIDGGYHYSCNIDASNAYTLDYTADNGDITVMCPQNDKTTNYSILPSFPPRKQVTGFRIRQCSLPNLPFWDLIERITSGNHQISHLSFQNNGKPSSSNLTREHFKNLNKVTRLVLGGGLVSYLPDDLFEDMPNLTWLILRSNEIRLHAGVFKPLPKLVNLELGVNKLRSLPDGLFANSQALEHLVLWKNELQNLTAHSFDGLDSLKVLDLSENNMQTLDPSVFNNLSNLKQLSLSFNNFSSFSEGFLDRNYNLETFSMRRNIGKISKLPNGFLGNLTRLTSVHLEESGIEMLEEDVFSGSTNIQNISLQRNLLVTIPGGLFKDQSELLNLDLSRNRITHISEDAFQSLAKLETLNLNHNKLKSIHGKLFSECKSLNRLEINTNQLSEIRSGSFRMTKNLKYIDFSHNNLRLSIEAIGSHDTGFVETSGMHDGFVPFGPISPFGSILGLTFLNLSHNSIETMFTDFAQTLLNLKYLDLSHNNFSSISYNELNFLGNNITVDLRSNLITEIDLQEMEQFLKDQSFPDNTNTPKPAHIHINVDNNPFNCNCTLYHFVKYLKQEMDPALTSFININPGNAVCHSPQKFEGKSLKSLESCEMLCDMDSHETKKKLCPENCECYVRMCDRSEIIKCSAKNMKLPLHLPNILSSLELNFENSSLNSMMSLGINRTAFNKIKKLMIANNNITELTVNDIPNNVTYLDLRKNSISHVDQEVVNKITNSSLEKLYMSGNPITCDCKNQPFLTFLQDKHLIVEDLNKMECSNTKESIRTLSVGDLCGSSKAIIISSVLLAIIGFLFGLSIALYYKYEMEIKVYLFTKGWLLWWISEEEVDKDKVYDAFISWSHKDDDFVNNKLLPELEGGPNPFKICVHYRDWVVGEMINSQITRTILDSRRTIVVLSPNFLQSVWGIYEFKRAHCHAIEEGRSRVIVIRYGDIGPTDKLDKELQAYLSTNTYLEWGDPRFWQKLRYALPHPSVNKHLNLPQSIITRKDDKLELIHPSSPSTPPGQNTPPAHQAHTNPLMNHVNSLPNGMKPAHFVNGSITLNGHKINGNAKHSDV